MLLRTHIVAKRKPKTDPHNEELKRLGVEVEEDNEVEGELVNVQLFVEDIDTAIETLIELEDGIEQEAVLLELQNGRQMVVAETFEYIADLRDKCEQQQENKFRTYLDKK